MHIHINGYVLEAASCPVCLTKHHPPAGVKICMARHKGAGQLGKSWLCVKCYQPMTLQVGMKYRGKVCKACRTVGGPHKVGRRRPYLDYIYAHTSMIW